MPGAGDREVNKIRSLTSLQSSQQNQGDGKCSALTGACGNGEGAGEAGERWQGGPPSREHWGAEGTKHRLEALG